MVVLLHLFQADKFVGAFSGAFGAIWTFRKSRIREIAPEVAEKRDKRVFAPENRVLLSFFRDRRFCAPSRNT